MAANEFRKDLVSGDWVLVSSSRARRPGAPEMRATFLDSHQAIEECPFENPIPANGQPVLVYRNGHPVHWEGEFKGEWTVMVVRNKYPALLPGVCGSPAQHGPFLTQVAHGFHELVITRDHETHFAQFSDLETTEVLRVYQDRYRAISHDECGDYISIFHNHGKEAGASIWHNHSQILSTPIIPPEVLRSLEGADEYYQQHQATVHCALIHWEREQKVRVVYENERFILFCPYVSKTPYEMRVFPKEHSARFELMGIEDIIYCAQALNAGLRALYKALGDAPYNFYIHTAPVERDPLIHYDYYHWHIEIVPKIKIEAGFELGTGLSLNPLDPDDVAAKLREALAS